MLTYLSLLFMFSSAIMGLLVVNYPKNLSSMIGALHDGFSTLLPAFFFFCKHVFLYRTTEPFSWYITQYCSETLEEPILPAWFQQRSTLTGISLRIWAQYTMLVTKAKEVGCTQKRLKSKTKMIGCCSKPVVPPHLESRIQVTGPCWRKLKNWGERRNYMLKTVKDWEKTKVRLLILQEDG